MLDTIPTTWDDSSIQFNQGYTPPPLVEPRGFWHTEKFPKFLLICIVVLTATMLSTASIARAGPWGWLDKSVYTELNDQDWKLLRSTAQDNLNNHPENQGINNGA